MSDRKMGGREMTEHRNFPVLNIPVLNFFVVRLLAFQIEQDRNICDRKMSGQEDDRTAEFSNSTEADPGFIFCPPLYEELIGTVPTYVVATVDGLC